MFEKSKIGLFLTLLLTPFFTFAQQYGWQPQTSATTNTLESVQFLDENHGWAVGGNKGLLWQKQNSGLTGSFDNLNAVWAFDENIAWAAGSGGIILKTINGGTDWVKQNSGINSTWEKLFFIDDQIGWVAGSGGDIRKTTNGGTSWNAQTSGTYSSLYGIFFFDAFTGWMVGMNGVIIKTTNGGTNWSAQTSGTTANLQAVFFIDANIGWAVGSNGTVLKTTNGGAAWTPKTSGTANEMEAVHFVDANTGWAAGDRATIIKTTDGGESWQIKTELVWPPYDLHGIAFLDDNTGYAVGTFGTILGTQDGGATWISQGSGTSSWLYDITLISGNVGWVVGMGGAILKMASGTIIHTADGGLTWNHQDAQTPNTLYDVDFINSQTGWIAGGKGTVLFTNDGGQQWRRQVSGTSKGLYGISFIDGSHGWLVGESGTILVTSDGGVTWNTQTSGTTDTLHAVVFIDQNNGLAVGDKGTLLRTSDGGQFWEKRTLTGQTLREIRMQDANTGWIVGDAGVVLKTQDGGVNWNLQQSGTNAALYSVAFINSEIGWAAGSNGTILKTTTGGEFWIGQNSGITGTLRSVSAIDAMKAWAVGENGTLITTSAATDNQGPVLTIAQPTPGQIFTIDDQPVLVSGTARDENGIVVKIGSSYLTLSGDNYTQSLFLPNGEQTIRVLASDRAGNIAAAEVTVQVNMNLPIGEIRYYLSGPIDTQQLSLSPYAPNVESETYIGSWTQIFETAMTGYLNGSEFKYKLKLRSGGMVVTLSWYLEFDSIQSLLASTSFLVNSTIYSNYTGTVTGMNSVGFPGQKLVFKVNGISPGGFIWGNGSNGSSITIPGGLELPLAAPELLAPVDGATDQPISLTLNWTGVSGASQYHLQVATDSLFVTKKVDIATLNDTFMNLSALEPGTTYFWRVRATNDGGPGPWSSVWKFTTVIQPPNQVALLVPGNGAIIEDDSVFFSWRQAGPEVIRYWFELATHADMSDAVIDTLLMAQDTSKRVDQLLPNQRYWWRVRARNKGGLGPWSPIWNFTVAKLPDQVTLVAPLNFASIHADSVQFIWRSSTPSVTKYWFEIASDSFMTHSVIDTMLTALDTSKIVHALVTQTYWWRVKAKNLAGWGPFSEKYTFSVLITKVQETPELPREFFLRQNYPNPFNASTIIQYSLPCAATVTLKIYDRLGREVAILVNGNQPAGNYRVQFDCQDLPVGLYFYWMRTEKFKLVRKMLVIK